MFIHNASKIIVKIVVNLTIILRNYDLKFDFKIIDHENL
jgi:hypothetical protein